MSNITCTVIKGANIWRSELPGLRPLMYLLNNERELLKDSYVIDKVIGKASALLLIYGGAKKVHGITMSKAAERLLSERNIEHSWDTMVDFIENNDRTDMCPMEKKVINIDDPEEAFITFSNFFKSKA